MSLTHRIVTATVKRIVRILARIDDSQWHKFPEEGPYLLAVNHVNFLEIPIMYTHLMPRPITGFVKAENWEKPLLRWLFTLWNGIPLHRGEADLTAVRAALAALNAGNIVTVAPEGTRTGDGRLRQAHPGVVLVALRANAPIYPTAYYGHETFWSDIRRWRRTDFKLQVGRPFYLDTGGVRVTRQIRQQMVDEIMYQIAALLPPQNRGYYANMAAATDIYLRFMPEFETL